MTPQRLVVAIKTSDGNVHEVVRVSRELFDEIDNGMIGFPAVYTVDGDKLLFHPKAGSSCEVMVRLEAAD